MFMSKLLIACALIVAAQADYGHKAVPGGYAAHIQPAATLSVMHHGDYKGYDGYNGHHGYAPAYDNYRHSALDLAKTALHLPSAGAPIPDTIVYKNYPSAAYSAPVYDAPTYDSYGHSGPATASTAAAAASKVAQNKARTAYAPVKSYKSSY